MNTLVIVLIAAVVLVAAYALYGRWLAKTWGIDPKAQTPAVKYNDGKDFVPANGWTVFSHQFSSIAGAGPVTGAIQAAVFGWLPVLLWILIGGVFFAEICLIIVIVVIRTMQLLFGHITTLIPLSVVIASVVQVLRQVITVSLW